MVEVSDAGSDAFVFICNTERDGSSMFMNINRYVSNAFDTMSIEVFNYKAELRRRFLDALSTYMKKTAELINEEKFKNAKEEVSTSSDNESQQDNSMKIQDTIGTGDLLTPLNNIQDE